RPRRVEAAADAHAERVNGWLGRHCTGAGHASVLLQWSTLTRLSAVTPNVREGDAWALAGATQVVAKASSVKTGRSTHPGCDAVQSNTCDRAHCNRVSTAVL